MITDEFVESLDDAIYCELVEVLKENFLNEYQQLKEIKDKRQDL